MKKKKILIVVVAIILIFLTVCAVVCILGRNDNSSYTPQVPELNIGGTLDYEAGKRPEGISIPTSHGYNLSSDKTEQDLTLENPSINSCDFIISIYLSDGTQIYKSELLSPGNSITRVQLKQPLQRGVYHNCVIVYDCYNHATGEPITRCEVVVELNCI